MTDHKKMAEKYIDEGFVEVAEDAEVTIATRTAQVHATLYLAEQQRIANLIALLSRLDNTVTVDRMDWDRPMPTERDTALAEIRTGLGLA